MKNLQKTNGTALVAFVKNGICFFCKESPKTILHVPRFPRYGICAECAGQVSGLLEDETLIEGQA